jgi:hypothetical protein
MRKWLDGLVAKATKRASEKVAEEAAERAVRKVKDTARGALDRAEEVLFGPDEAEPARPADADRTPAQEEERRGALQKAREDADRRGRERVAAEAAAEKKKQAEIDDELAQMKRRLGRR